MEVFEAIILAGNQTTRHIHSFITCILATQKCQQKYNFIDFCQCHAGQNLWNTNNGACERQENPKKRLLYPDKTEGYIEDNQKPTMITRWDFPWKLWDKQYSRICKSEVSTYFLTWQYLNQTMSLIMSNSEVFSRWSRNRHHALSIGNTANTKEVLN